MPKAKKKPTEGSPPKWFIRFPKPKRKARLFGIVEQQTSSGFTHRAVIECGPGITADHLRRTGAIPVREILPSPPAKKRGKR
jgi:hypothetical protein